MKGALLLLCGLAGGVAGGLLVSVLGVPDGDAQDARARGASRDAVSRAAFEARLQEVQADVDGLRAEVARLRAGGGGGRAAPAPPRDASPGGSAEAGDGDVSGEEPPPMDDAAIRELVARFVGRPFGSAEANRLFTALTIRKERIGDVIAAIEKEIEARPEDADLRVALATAWVAELTNNTLPGPQQGLAWGKAVEAYDKAIELDPNHWQARFGKAFGTSMAPEFLGMRPQAIEQFEELLAIQERRAPEPQFSQTYFRLGTLYKDAGNLEKAREIWDRGLDLFPESDVLRGTLEVSTKK